MSSVMHQNCYPELSHTVPYKIPPVALTNTIHVAYKPGIPDRGDLYVYFRNLPGFSLIGFYDTYCFVRFFNRNYATAALATSPFGCVTVEPAKNSYKVPYPQPHDDHITPCNLLHITHLPPNYTKEELYKIFSVFPGFLDLQLNGKYGYVHFSTETGSSAARKELRTKTNLVVSYAKNPSSKLTETAGYLKQNQMNLLPSAEYGTGINGANLNILTGNQYGQAVNYGLINQVAAARALNQEIMNSQFAPKFQGDGWPNSPSSRSSPPPLSAQSTPHSNYSEFPWSRRSSSDSSFNNSRVYIPNIEQVIYNEEQLLAQKYQLLQLQNLQQQQLSLYQREQFRPMYMGKENFANGARSGLPTPKESNSIWSPFESKLGFAISPSVQC